MAVLMLLLLVRLPSPPSPSSPSDPLLLPRTTSTVLVGESTVSIELAASQVYVPWSAKVSRRKVRRPIPSIELLSTRWPLGTIVLPFRRQLTSGRGTPVELHDKVTAEKSKQFS